MVLDLDQNVTLCQPWSEKSDKNYDREPARKVDVDDDDAKEEPTKKENDVDEDVDYDDDAKEEPAKKVSDVDEDVDYDDDDQKEPAKKENDVDDAKEEPAKKELWIPLSSPSRSRALAVHQGAPPSFKTFQRPKIFTQNVCDEEKK